MQNKRGHSGAQGPDIRALAKRLHEAYLRGEEVANAAAKEILNTHGRATLLAVFHEVDRIVDFEHDEVEREHERHEQHMAEVNAIFSGLPRDGLSFQRACEIKAAQGDALAKRHLDLLTSRSYRLEVALTDAAVERHPGWRQDADHVLTRIDDSAPDIPELIEWFQKNFPTEAKAIEAAIDVAPKG